MVENPKTKEFITTNPWSIHGLTSLVMFAAFLGLSRRAFTHLL